jgi:putative ABC transport system permease protein
MFNGIGRDLAYAARTLAKARGFTFVCVVSLGIGMAPVIAIPSLSRLTTLTPPGVNTEELVELVTTSVGPHQQTEQWSYPDYVDLRDANTGTTLIGWIGAQSEITFPATGGSKLRASTMFVSANYFKTLGVALSRGAGFDAAADDPLSAEPVVILNYQFWQNHLSSDPDIVGKTLTMDSLPHVVVGVAPAQFGGHIGFTGWDLFVPLERHPRLLARTAAALADEVENFRADRSKEWLNIHGRLSPGVTVQQASAAVAAVTAQLAKAYPATNEFKAGIAGAYDPLGILQRSQLRMIQTAALTLTGIVLLVVSLNISGMMQVRGAIRERELSIRQAIGASRVRLAQYLLSESIVLACAGGALASIVIFNIPSLLPWLTDDPIPPQILEALRVDVPMVAVCFGLCLVTSLVFGWLPAMQFSRPAILSSLKDDAGGGGGMRAGRVHRVTAALQVAIAVPLLVMSGQSLDRVRATATSDLGFASDLLYAVPLKLGGLTINQAGFEIRKATDTLVQASGVASVTVADGLPLDFRGRRTRVSVPVDANTAPRPIAVQVTRVGDGYLKTMGVPLVRGREFTAADAPGTEPVTIVSKLLADRLVPGGDLIGTTLMFGADPRAQQALTIVGVTADFPTDQMSSTREQLLLPLAQHPGVNWNAVAVVDDRSSAAHVMLVARSAPGEPAKKLTTALEKVARELDPEFQPTAIVTGVGLREFSMNDFLTQSAVSAAAGGVILLLAALGIYGVVGLMVATRTREIAVRAALGATRRRVLVMIIRDVVKLVLPGTIVGVVLTIALNRLNAENMGISLSNAEPIAYVAGPVIAVLVAVLASLAPARRAASVQPMVAMRSV